MKTTHFMLFTLALLLSRSAFADTTYLCTETAIPNDDVPFKVVFSHGFFSGDTVSLFSEPGGGEEQEFSDKLSDGKMGPGPFFNDVDYSKQMFLSIHQAYGIVGASSRDFYVSNDLIEKRSQGIALFSTSQPDCNFPGVFCQSLVLQCSLAGQ